MLLGGGDGFLAMLLADWSSSSLSSHSLAPARNSMLCSKLEVWVRYEDQNAGGTPQHSKSLLCARVYAWDFMYPQNCPVFEGYTIIMSIQQVRKLRLQEVVTYQK